MNSRMKRFTAPEFLVAALAMTAIPQAASAQETSDATATEEASNNSDEILVTAQRREERLIDVPISVTALSAETLENAGITDTADLDVVTPGLRMDQSGAFVQPAIRGISTTITGAGDANVSTYVDGVFQPAMVQALFSLRDVRSVEVLKGPQGTLFGRNATGGAILVNTLPPDLDAVTGEIALGYSSFRTVEASEFVSLPLIEGVAAASLSSSVKHMAQGYVKDLLNRDFVGEYSSVVTRAKLRFLPWDGADFTLTGVYTDIKDGNIYTRTSYQGVNSRRSTAILQGLVFADDPYEYSGDTRSISTLKYWSTSLRGEIDVGPGTLTTTSAYVNVDQFNRLDNDNLPLPLVVTDTGQKTTSFSQELIYATEQLGPVRAIAGVFYFDKHNDGNTIVNNFASAIYAIEDIEAWAVFGEATVTVTDGLYISGGVRYSSETFSGGRGLTQGGTQVRPPVPITGAGKWTSLDPRATIRYEISPDSNIYATYSKGFKSGFLNTAAPNDASGRPSNVDPERITAYEVGFKGALAPGFLLNVAGFYYDYKDLHQLVRTRDQFNNNLNITQNAAEARVKGVEVSGSMRVSDAFRLGFGATYLDAKFTSFPNALVTLWNPLAATPLTQSPIDATGNTMVRSPELSGNITASYNQETPSGTFGANATLFATSEIFHEAGNRVVEDGYVKLNASVSWQPPASSLKVTLFGKNLTDSATIMATTFSTSYDAFSYEPPRSYGIELSYEF